MLFLINKLKSAFSIKKAANIRHIEFKKVALQVYKSMLINKCNVEKKSVHWIFLIYKAKIKNKKASEKRS